MRASLAILGVFALSACKPAATTNDVAAQNNAATAEPAEDPSAVPDLKGKWVGTSESIVTGMSKHHEAATGDKPLLDNIEFTYVIEGQDGRRFWGTLTSPNFEEMMTGVVAKDGTIVARISEGEVRGHMVDPDTIDIVYSGGGRNSTVVATNTWKRVRE